MFCTNDFSYHFVNSVYVCTVYLLHFTATNRRNLTKHRQACKECERKQVRSKVSAGNQEKTVKRNQTKPLLLIVCWYRFHQTRQLCLLIINPSYYLAVRELWTEFFWMVFVLCVWSWREKGKEKGRRWIGMLIIITWMNKTFIFAVYDHITRLCNTYY